MFCSVFAHRFLNFLDVLTHKCSRSCQLRFILLFPHIWVVSDSKQRADRDDTPPHTPTGNALSSESDLDVSSPSNEAMSSGNNPIVSQEEDERLAKELSLKEAAAHDLSHRPKRRRFHESYNFNMKCPTPGCNSLGEGTTTVVCVWGFCFTFVFLFLCAFITFIPLSFSLYSRASNGET